MSSSVRPEPARDALAAPPDGADRAPRGRASRRAGASSTRSASASSARSSPIGSPQRALGTSVDGQPPQPDLERAVDHVDQRRLAHRARRRRRPRSRRDPAPGAGRRSVTRATLSTFARSPARIAPLRSRRCTGPEAWTAVINPAAGPRSRAGPDSPSSPTRSPTPTSTWRSCCRPTPTDLVDAGARRVRAGPRRGRVRRRRHGVRARGRRRRRRRRARHRARRARATTSPASSTSPATTSPPRSTCCATGHVVARRPRARAHRRRPRDLVHHRRQHGLRRRRQRVGQPGHLDQRQRRSTCSPRCARSPPTRPQRFRVTVDDDGRSTPTRGWSRWATRAPTRAA